MGSPKAKAYLASPETVAASALRGKIAGSSWYQKPEGVEKVIIGEGSGDHVADKARSVEDALDKLLGEVDQMIATAEGASVGATEQQPSSPITASKDEALTEILPGFPERIEGEIVFCDGDNINTDGIYPYVFPSRDSIYSSLRLSRSKHKLTVYITGANTPIRITCLRRRWPRCVWRTTTPSSIRPLRPAIF